MPSYYSCVSGTYLGWCVSGIWRYLVIIVNPGKLFSRKQIHSYRHFTECQFRLSRQSTFSERAELICHLELRIRWFGEMMIVHYMDKVLKEHPQI